MALPRGFLLLAVYWFHPLIWLAYVLLCRDIELACDEQVIREMGAESKKPYSQALLRCSVHRGMIAACPLAAAQTGELGETACQLLQLCGAQRLQVRPGGDGALPAGGPL